MNRQNFVFSIKMYKRAFFNVRLEYGHSLMKKMLSIMIILKALQSLAATCTPNNTFVAMVIPENEMSLHTVFNKSEPQCLI